MIALALGGALAGAYLLGVRSYGARHPHRTFSSAHVAAFVAGAILMTGALTPPVEALADRSFADHMAQHVILTFVAPPLMLLGAPLLLVVAAPSQRIGRRLAAAARHPFFHALLAPLTGWLAMVAVLWGVHFSPIYEIALVHPAVHALEHALFISAAFLFWMPVVQTGYAPQPVAYPARMLYLFLALPQGAFLGLALYASRHVMYAHYAAQLGVRALADQQNGGAVMWIAGGFFIFAAFMITVAAWARSEWRTEAVP